MMPMCKLLSLSLLVLTLRGGAAAQSVDVATPEPLDPARALMSLPAQPHVALPEQYVWTADDITVLRKDRGKYSWSRTELRVAPHYFRAHFVVKSLPRAATVYIAGPREASVYLNGHLLGEFSSDPGAPINFRVFHADALHGLRVGDNVVAVAAVRGRGVVTGAGPDTTHQLAYGEVLVVKILPAAFGVEAQPLVITDTNWRSSAAALAGWFDAGFDDSAWRAVASLGPVESNVDLLQWSADAGMYGWPGYRGMSPWLRTYSMNAAAVTHVYAGRARFDHLDTLTSAQAAGPFTISTPPAAMNPVDAEAPSLLLDFGREVAGRLLVESASAVPARISIAYGESEIEAMSTGLTSGQRGGNYMGTNLLEVPGNGTARGPKSAFRYVHIRFLRGAPAAQFKAIRLEGIAYPVEYKGAFESSDARLNRIWEMGAYTAHLCMQDGVWDAPKRDRGRWIGDIDVEGRVIDTVFGDPRILEDTLQTLAESTPADQYVNGIAGYSGLWVTSLESLYMHSGDVAYLESQHAALLRILARMDRDIGPDNLLVASTHGWGFVDWSPGLYGATAETRIGTNLQYLRAYAAAARLLHFAGDETNAAKYAELGRALSQAASAYIDAHGTVGRTWQLNALAVLDGMGDAAPQIWPEVLAHVKQDAPTDQAITPYFNAYVLDAMSALNHRAEALAWLRTYWGGMIDEGATSFWENYDLRWPKTDYALSLQADGTSGYFVSLAHGWSSGPTAWLAENVLGITPASPGYATVNVRPDLLGLEFARGAVPTPHGNILIRIDRQGIVLDLPAGIAAAHVTYSPQAVGQMVYVDGEAVHGSVIEITQAGHHVITAH